jgi:hypothetical protein
MRTQICSLIVFADVGSQMSVDLRAARPSAELEG